MNENRRRGWRDTQTGFQRAAFVRGFWRRLAGRGALGALFGLMGILGLLALFRIEGAPTWATVILDSAPQPPVAELISRKEVASLLNEKVLSNLTEKTVELQSGEQVLQVETTLDPDLQSYLLKKVDRRNSRYVGIVVMDARTGRLLAMTAFDKTDPEGNPCLRSDFPAASIFKIVTAASAVDEFGYTAETSLHFNGYKHTLYKRQLTDAVNRYTNTVSLEEAFADSVNPVFGKIGQLRLGKSLLEKSAEAFGFNEPLDFELPLDPSRFRVSDEPYHWAEVASGFNLDTTISPLHGAMMVSAVLNEGQMVSPSLVDSIIDTEGKVLYRWQPGQEHQAMSGKAASTLTRMMEATIRSGTARKPFRNYRKDKVLSHLEIGGKTGSIGNRTHDLRYDWFVGFARERQGGEQVVIAVLVAHEEYIGIRAAEYARMAFKYYFGNQPAKDPLPST